MSFALRCAALFAMLVTASLAVADDLSPMTAACMKSCDNDDKAFCKSFCTCTSQEMGKYKGQDRESALRSDATIKQVASRCLGRHFSSFFLGDGCSADCGANKTCNHRCQCIKGKLRGLGEPDRIEEFLGEFATENAAATKKMDEWKAACEAG